MHSLSSPRVHEFLTRYQAEPYEPHGGYKQWAFSFFQDTRRVLNLGSHPPTRRHRARASFTAFLYWQLPRPLPQHPAVDLRCIEDR